MRGTEAEIAFFLGVLPPLKFYCHYLIVFFAQPCTSAVFERILQNCRVGKKEDEVIAKKFLREACSTRDPKLQVNFTSPCFKYFDLLGHFSMFQIF